MKDDRKPEDIPDRHPTSTGLGRTDGSSTRRKKKQAARDRLEEIQAVEDPVKRIKQLAIFFRRGLGDNITSDLDMKTFLDTAQAQAFNEIKSIAKQTSDPRSYLKDVLIETDPDLIDDYHYRGMMGMGLVEQVRRKVERLLEYSNSDDSVSFDNTPHEGRGTPADKLQKTLRLTIEEIERQEEATNFLKEICKEVGEQVSRSPDAIRSRLEDKIIPHLRSEWPDLNIPDNLVLDDWRASTGDLREALKRWEMGS